MADPSALLKEKVIQFGTGILLRGLPDYFIDKANRNGIFEGRIVIVKSTAGSAEEFEREGCEFLTCVRGIENGKIIEEDIVNRSISRVLSAGDQWLEILKLAKNPDIQVIISNTTEVGIQFEPESIFHHPPKTFPGKLTSILYERFRQLGNDSGKLVVIPTELIPDNGKQLKGIVLKQADHNQLGDEFITWISRYVLFCNSLVDRIVTRPSDMVKSGLQHFNSLTIQTEPYRLWAIEGNKEVKDLLSFSKADEGIIIDENIDYYRERKIRLLNGTHTISVCLGYLLGLDTVYQCMKNEEMHKFIEHVMLKEIEPTLSLGSTDKNRVFAESVLDRFRNPYTAHRLLSITLQATAKMKMRNVETFVRSAEQNRVFPDLMARGFAAYLLFLRSTRKDGAKFFGIRNGAEYQVQDDQAEYFYNRWNETSVDRDGLENLVRKIGQNISLWDKDLTQLPKFVETVAGHLYQLMNSVKL